MMLLYKILGSALTFSVAGGLIVAPAMAEVPFDRAEVRTVVNRVEAVDDAGQVQPLAPQDCLCPGQTLVTQGLSQAEIQFNDGSLVRVGEQAQLKFYPTTRILTLLQGTTLLFSFPDQGRINIETPNAWASLDSNAAVVRYVPTRNLTLIMALANSAAGPVSFAVKATEQQGTLPAGHMALISNAGLQVIEFDLVEFYRTSRLVLGLNAESRSTADDRANPVALLRPQLLNAIVQQQPFADTTPILDPALINPLSETPSLFNLGDGGWPSNSLDQGNPAQRPNSPPPGVVTPLPAIEPTEPTPPVEPPPIEPPPVEPAPPAEPPVPAQGSSGNPPAAEPTPPPGSAPVSPPNTPPAQGGSSPPAPNPGVSPTP